MTTATAATEEGTTPKPENEGEDGRVNTESILSVAEDEEAAVDSPDAEAALLAGWKRTNAAGDRIANAKKDDVTDVEPKNGDTVVTEPGEDEEAAAERARAEQARLDAEDPEIAGLGMRASAVKAALAEVDTLRKSVASTSGHLGHLKQLVTQQAGKGKGVTREQLKRVADEFGGEFADALATDLSEAGFGGGAGAAAPDPAQVDEIVNARVEERVRSIEKKLVLTAHPDAEDYFAIQKTDAAGKPILEKVKGADGQEIEAPVWDRGPKNAAFMEFVGKLPPERQKELSENGWDSTVIGRALSEFKAQEKKATTQQATQSRRLERAAAPTRSSGSHGAPPTIDPIEAGWRNVKGRATGRAKV